MADKKFNIKDQLAGIAALIAAVVAIGGGFAKYGELTTKITALEEASKKVDKVSIEMVAVLQEKVAALENKEEVVVDLSSIETDISYIDSDLAKATTKGLVNAKEIELLKVQIEEIKVSTSNPLTN
jgi:hypothetical protein